jgi:hypothetical protein
MKRTLIFGVVNFLVFASIASSSNAASVQEQMEQNSGGRIGDCQSYFV